MATVTTLVPLTDCPKCGKRAIVELTPAQRLAQPDDTTHVCHPSLGGCNHGFTDSRTLRTEFANHRELGDTHEDEAYAFGGGAAADNHAEELAERAAQARASYGWIIDRETVSTENDANISPQNRTPSRAGWVGPRNIAPEIEQELRNGKGQQFRMYDDDGILYYEGRYIGPDDETAFGPLSDLGTPDAGAVRIDYKGKAGRWETL